MESGNFFASRDEVVQHLEGLGFHQTPRYASGGGFGRDFSRVVSHPCGGSSFREQAIIRQQGGCWTYNTQGPEPNPEVLGYIWPRLLGWPGYVRWWHLSFPGVQVPGALEVLDRFGAAAGVDLAPLSGMWQRG